MHGENPFDLGTLPEGGTVLILTGQLRRRSEENGLGLLLHLRHVSLSAGRRNVFRHKNLGPCLKAEESTSAPTFHIHAWGLGEGRENLYYMVIGRRRREEGGRKYPCLFPYITSKGVEGEET